MHIRKPSEALCLWKRRGKERASERGKKTRRCSAYGCGERKRYLCITWKRDGDGESERERERTARNSGTKERRRKSEGREKEREDYRGRWLERRTEGERERKREMRRKEKGWRGERRGERARSRHAAAVWRQGPPVPSNSRAECHPP